MSKVKTSVNVVEEKQDRLAVLIDADNASAKTIRPILAECTKFGETICRRLYGNFVGDNGKWKDIVNEHAIKIRQQFAFTKGKNATDGFMIIDAMDLLYTGRYDGFCIVSSDSDFTALAIRLKEQGVAVYGFGEKKTPTAFRNACTQFVYVENLVLTEGATQTVTGKPEIKKQDLNDVKEVKPAEIELPVDIIKKIFEQFDDEWIRITALASTWKRLQVDADPRNWGCKNFPELIKKYSDVFLYEMRTENKEKSDQKQEHIYVKLKIK